MDGGAWAGSSEESLHGRGRLGGLVRGVATWTGRLHLALVLARALRHLSLRPCTFTGIGERHDMAEVLAGVVLHQCCLQCGSGR